MKCAHYSVDVAAVRRDFPLLQQRRLIYFDNACTTLKPMHVIQAIRDYYERLSACAGGRSLHTLARETTEACEAARGKLAHFFGAKREEVVFVRNATEALNAFIAMLDLRPGERVVTSNMEHHSVLLPLLAAAKRRRIKLDYVLADKQGLLNAEALEAALAQPARLLALHHTTNTTGAQAPLKEAVKAAHDAGALVLLDAAQGAPHTPINFATLGVDAMAVSAHKALGPTGIGALVAKRRLLEELEPPNLGGETIKEVKLSHYVLETPPAKFEAGIQHYAGIIGWGAAVDYLQRIGFKAIEAHERRLTTALLDTLSKVSGVELYGPSAEARACPLACFNVKGVEPQVVAALLDEQGVAVRSGFFCAQPAMEYLGATGGAVRASLYFYNTLEELSVFGEAVAKIAKLT